MALTLALAVGPTVPTPAPAVDACHRGPTASRRRSRAGLSGTEAREAATERVVLRMVALCVPAVQAARFGYAGGRLGLLLSAFAE